MMDLLKTIKTKLVESEDDLFPGFDSSAFDEHYSQTQTKRSSTEEHMQVEGLVERLMTLYDDSKRAVNRLQAKMRQNSLMFPNYSAASSSVKYSTVNGLQAAHPRAYEKLKSFSFDPASPMFNDLPGMVAVYDKILAKIDMFEKRIQTAKAKASRLRRVAAQEQTNKKKNIPKNQIPESSIPKKIQVEYFTVNSAIKRMITEDIDNPYWDYSSYHTVEKYAGHPIHFDWKGRELTQYYMIANFASMLGLPELDTLHLRRIDYNSRSNVLVYYLTNSDGSFHFFRRPNGWHKLYTKDAETTIYERNITTRNINEARKNIAKVAREMKIQGVKS